MRGIEKYLQDGKEIKEKKKAEVIITGRTIVNSERMNNENLGLTERTLA